MTLLSLKTAFIRRFPEVSDRFTTLRWIWRDLLNDRGRRVSILLFFVILVGSAVSVAQPYGIGMIMSALGEKNDEILRYGLWTLVGFFFVEQAITWIRQYVREIVFNVNFWHIPMRLTRQYFERTLGMLVSEDADIDGGGVESTRDKIWTIQDHMLFTILPGYSTSLFAVVACFWVDGVLGLLSLVYVCADIAFAYRQNNHIHRVMEPIARALRDWDRKVRGRWGDASTVKYNGVERRIEAELTREVEPVLKEDFHIWARWFPRSLFRQKILGGFFRLGIYALAGFQVLEGSLSIEGFTLLVFSLERITDQLQEISNGQRVIQENMIRVRAYREALTKKPDFDYREGELFETPAKGVSIELRNVALTQTVRGEEVYTLRDVSLKIEKGEHVAIIGPSGAGKTQLANLILRAFDPACGAVLINGKDIRAFALESVCRYVGHVPQGAEVFEGTIRDNVCFGLSPESMRTVTDCDVHEAIRKAGLNFSGRLHDGLDTKIGYRGMKLSGGERQRLTIARAHIKNPKLVVADEATSALDSLSEAHVLDELYSSLEEGTTAIMIAHRLSSLTRCTKIVFVRPLDCCKEGEEQVSTYTSMEELYNSDALFRKMADQQGFRP